MSPPKSFGSRLTRRVLLASLATVSTSPARAFGVAAAAGARIAAIERRVGGLIGVAALDTGSGAWIRHRADERFAMCSTFKFALAARVLAAVERGGLRLDQPVAYGPADVLSYAPVTRTHLAEGHMTVADLCAAAMEVSDNTAANLLLRETGGPSGLTAWLRRHGDRVTRLDRTEPTLNTNLPGDPRDTSTPTAMVALMRTLLIGRMLQPASRERLIGWLRASTTGLGRLRAGLPRDWIAGDKTGTGDNGAINDIAVAWPPNRPPILIVAYMDGSMLASDALSAAHAEIGALVAAAFA